MSANPKITMTMDVNQVLAGTAKARAAPLASSTRPSSAGGTWPLSSKPIISGR